MAIQFIQFEDMKITSTSAQSIELSSGFNTTAGNTLICLVIYWRQLFPDAEVSSITDTAGNSYTKVARATHDDYTTITSEIWYSTGIKAQTSNKVKANFSGAINYPWMSVAEFSGVSALDDDATNSSTGTVLTSGEMEASTDDSVILGVYSMDGVRTFVTGDGYTKLHSGTSGYDFGQYKILDDAGTYEAVTGTLAASTDAAVTGAIFFKGAETDKIKFMSWLIQRTD